MSRELVRRAICRWCHECCRVAVHSIEGKLARIEEDHTDPRYDPAFQWTKACPRLAGAREYIYHPDRVRFPLKRAGERGENKWQQVSWEQALDEIAAKLDGIKEKYGPESLMITSGTGRTTMWSRIRFSNLFGSPNYVGQGSVCYGPRLARATAMLGWMLGLRPRIRITPDANGKPMTKCVFVIGANDAQSFPRSWKLFLDAKRAGVKIIVVDPVKTRTAELADIWLQPRPGTDTALLLSMIHTIIEDKLYDKEFVGTWCYGFEKVAERAQEYPLDKAAKITWVPEKDIRKAAHMYALERPGVNLLGLGLEHSEDNQGAIQANIILSAILGNIDVEGGDYIGGPVDCISDEELELNDKLSSEQKRKQIGADRFKLLTFPGRELISEHSRTFWGRECTLRSYANFPLVLRAAVTGKPYPIRAGITTFSNPMVTQANVKLVYEALKSLDLYVVNDFWLTPSALLADYVLPTACWLERPQLEPAPGMNVIVGGEAALPAVVPNEHEYWTDYEFFRGLGMRLGQEEYWPWQTLEDVSDFRLAPLGITFSQFMSERDGLYFPPDQHRKFEKMGGFGTRTRRLELYSTVSEQLGYDPLPQFIEPKESPISTPGLAEEYPYILITGGRFQPYFHSEHRQVESIRKRRREPQVQLHPNTAQHLGINNGDWVWLETPRGKVKQKCLCFKGIHPQVVHAEHGWWFPELPGEEPTLGGVWESNVNVLTDDDPERCNPQSGGWPLRTSLCKVYKAEE